MNDQENQNTGDQQNNEQGQQNQNQGNWNQGNQQQQGNWNQGSQQEGNWQQGNQQQGNWQQSQQQYNQQVYYQAPYRHDNKKMAAGLLGILLGCWGIHKFILGYNNEGLILLGATLGSIVLMCVGIGFFTFAIPCIIGFIEGIIYLTKSDEEFYQTYQVRKQAWF